jgi:spectinomycin phosphotransferase
LGTDLQSEYLPLGGGSHHWSVAGRTGRRWFVSVDDLTQKGYLGDTRDAAFDALRSALDTAHTLKQNGGLDFIVAPLPGPNGETVRRIDERFALAVYPFVDGTPGRFGERFPPPERAALVRLLVRLHRATPLVERLARPVSPRLPARHHLDRALGELDKEWTGGPFSETARALLTRHAAGVRRLLDAFDGLLERVEASAAKRVITHGETHGGNIIQTDGGLLLIDWDTAGLALPERDLWMVDGGDGDELNLYTLESGRPVDEAAIALYTLRWQLDDISLFLDDLRSKHERTEDTAHALDALRISLEMENLRS